MGTWLFTSTHNATVLSHRPKTECCPYNMMNSDPHAHTYTHWPPLLFPLFWPRLTRTPSVTLQREIDYRKEIFCLSGLLCFTGLQVFLCPPPALALPPLLPLCLSHYHLSTLSFLSLAFSHFSFHLCVLFSPLSLQIGENTTHLLGLLEFSRTNVLSVW